MSEKPQPDPVPIDDPQITTPVIEIQRMSNKSVKIIPRMDGDDQRDFAREDEDALLALEQIEKSLRGQLPG